MTAFDLLSLLVDFWSIGAPHFVEVVIAILFHSRE